MTTPGTSLTVRFNPVVAWSLLIIGGLGVAMLVIAFLTGTAIPPSGFVAPLILAFGAERLNKEYFTYTAQTDAEAIELPETLFAKRRPYSTRDGGRFLQKGSRIILVEQSGKQRTLRVRRYLSHRSDWDAFIEALEQRRGTT